MELILKLGMMTKQNLLVFGALEIFQKDPILSASLALFDLVLDLLSLKNGGHSR